MKRTSFCSLSVILLISTLAFMSTSLLGCGGGGGGGDNSFSGAASVSVDLTPSKIDSGDETRVQIWVGDVHPNGIALKVRYPVGLTFVVNSALLTIGDKTSRIKPRFDVVTSDKRSTYLVFFLPQRLFLPPKGDYQGEAGLVELRLRGLLRVRGGLVEVDADVNNTRIPDEVEFDINSPNFTPADQRSIEVVGSQ